MSYDLDPWEIISIEPTQDKRAIKKAYAKLLKQTSPESDPEGFKRLRWAYEVVQVLASQPEVEANTAQLDTVVQNQASDEMHPNSAHPERPISIAGPSLEETDLVSEIIRSLAMGLEEQAIAYLDEIVESQTLISIEKRSALENRVFDFLYGLEEQALWPVAFCQHFIQALELTALAEHDRNVDEHLEYIRVRSECKNNGWSLAQYREWQSDKQTVQEVMVSLRQALFDGGEDDALEALEAWQEKGVFTNTGFVQIMVERYLAELDDYFPGSFPLIFSERLHQMLGLNETTAANQSEAWLHLVKRREAAIDVETLRNVHRDYPNSAKAIAISVFLGLNQFNNHITIKTRHIFREMQALLASYDRYSPEAKQFELGGDEQIQHIRDWTRFNKHVSADVFEQGEEHLAGLTANMKSLWMFVGALSAVFAVLFIFTHWVSDSSEKTQNLVSGIGILSGVGIACGVGLGLIYGMRKYMAHYIMWVRHNLGIHEDHRTRMTGLLLSLSFIMSYVLDLLGLEALYLSLMVFVGSILMTPMLASVLIIFALIPALEMSKLLGVYEQGGFNLVCHTFMVWVTYLAATILNAGYFRYRPGATSKTWLAYFLISLIFVIVFIGLAKL